MGDLGDKVKDAKRDELIDTIIATLYARGVRGYGVSRKILDNNVVQLIKKELEKTEAPRELQSETEYRLERFRELLGSPETVKTEVLKRSRREDISFEDAFEKLSEN
ncbi:hypothetical protein GOV11_05305 [Candidatus Woesearchaeota archaeon]|nr:hypothetical protein [Candidatus Woesearchaeota archaeon]